MKRLPGYLLLIVYLCVSLLSFLKLVKPDARLFYHLYALAPEKIAADDGFSYRYALAADVLPISAADKFLLYENDRALARSDPGEVVRAGGGKFALLPTEDGAGMYLYFAPYDQIDPGQRFHIFFLLYPPGDDSQFPLAAGLIFWGLGVAELVRFVSRFHTRPLRSQALLRRVGGALDAFVLQVVDDLAGFYRRFCAGGRVYVWVSSAVAVCLFMLTFLRAANTGLTYDEAFSYQTYSNRLADFLQIGLANNHLLNSLLVHLACALTGIQYNELVIRLPNLLFYALYLWAAIRISALFEEKVLLLGLLGFNYYLSEFFGLARGYGMAAALLLAGLYVYYRGRNDPVRIVAATYLFLLACASSLSLLVFLGCFGAYVLAIDLRSPGRAGFVRRYWPHLAVQLAGAAGLGVMFLGVTQAGLPLYGSTDPFFEAVILGYATMFVPQGVLAVALGCLLAVYYLAAGVALRGRLLDKPFTILLGGYFLLTAILAMAFQRPLPTGRVLLPVWPLLALSLVELYAALRSRLRNPRRAVLAAAAGHALVLLMLVNFLFSIQLGYTREWKDDYQVRAQIYRAAILHQDLHWVGKTPTQLFYLDKIPYDTGLNLSTLE
ncbi:MAG: hypothetical protein VB089_19855 [Anaerolineaceae bacterium]|nr:hypothetical protein [Anaerolineaceae bacterium]